MIYILETISASVLFIPGKAAAEKSPVWFQFFLLNWDHFDTHTINKTKNRLKCVNNSYVNLPFLGGEVFLFYSQTSHDSQSSHLPQIGKI